jgi:predicted amidohydrolase YtcJ
VALDAYSTAVAHQAFADDASGAGPGWGRIEPGASADLVHLARDPRDVAAADIPTIPVIATYLAGTPRYRATA